MLKYIFPPFNILEIAEKKIFSFISNKDSNIDQITVKSFGEEWDRFNDFSDLEIDRIGNEYFDIVSDKHLNKNAYVLDVGCGSGRWSRFIAKKVHFVEAIDPSSAVVNAVKMTGSCGNVRVTQASVDYIPFENNSFDFVFSLGVLHHIPDTQSAMTSCIQKLKPGGYFLVYLYYKFDNKNLAFKFIFRITNLLRIFISRLPSKMKIFLCDVLALLIYFPLARFSRLIKIVSKKKKYYQLVPLNYYQDKSFYIMRNDSLDRFGTPLEQRFTKNEILKMMNNAGLTEVEFSDKAPFWHAIGKKAES